MEALLEKTTREDQRIAKTSVDRLRKASRKLSLSEKSIEITLKHSNESLHLPRKAISLLSTIISNMAAGKSMALILSDTSIGTQEAANFLEVSRPYIVRLLEKGEIPFSKVGTHRRIKISDLVAYQKKMKTTRRKQLNFLLTSDTISFADLKEKLNIDYVKDALIQCNDIAERTGLSQLTLEDINAEINAVRDEKNHH